MHPYLQVLEDLRRFVDNAEEALGAVFLQVGLGFSEVKASHSAC